MWIFYTFAMVPVAIGAFLMYRDKEIVWWEWLIGSACAFLLAAIMHGCAVWGMTADIETWSGEVVKVSHYPRWVEEYEQEHEESYTDSDGKSHTRTWTTTEHDTHYEYWTVTRNFGTFEDEPKVDVGIFNEISVKFGGHLYTSGTQSYDHFGGRFDGGDRNIYSVNNDTRVMEPVTTTKHFKNKIKAAPSVFSFSKVPTNINVYPWPENDDWRHSGRLCGTSTVLVNLYKWDCLNSYLGPQKKVNLILVGFGKEGEEYGHYQQAKWIGGKKNDLVLCFGGATRNKSADWSYVFGWTENELVKKNLQTILLENPINDDIIPLIRKEVQKNYVIKDWHKFDYITIEPPSWAYWVYFILMIVTQAGLYIWFHNLTRCGNPYPFRVGEETTAIEIS